MSRGAGATITPDDILYGRQRSADYISPAEKRATEIKAVYDQLPERQRLTLRAIFELENIERNDGLSDLFVKPHTRWDVSAICMQLGDHIKTDREQRHKLRDETNAALRRLKAQKLLYTKSYPGQRRVRWKLSDDGMFANDLYRDGKL